MGPYHGSMAGSPEQGAVHDEFLARQCIDPVNPADLVEVGVKVPSSRLAEFYSMFGRWLSGAFEVTELPDRVSTRPWDTTHSDRKLATQILMRLTPPAKRILEVLASSPGERFDGDQLAEKAQIPNGRSGVFGALAWPSRRFAQFHRPLPVLVEPGKGGSLFWVEERFATMILDGLRGEFPTAPKSS